MAASSGAERAAQTIQGLLANPYVKKITEDPDLRDNAKVAFASAREAIDRAKGSDNIINAIFDDKELQARVATAGRSVADVRGRLVEPPPRARRRWGRRLFVVLVGAGLAIALSEGLRNKVLDLLFGAEEEFDYVSTTAPPAEAEVAPSEPAVAAEPEATADATEATEAVKDAADDAKDPAEKA